MAPCLCVVLLNLLIAGKVKRGFTHDPNRSRSNSNSIRRRQGSAMFVYIFFRKFIRKVADLQWKYIRYAWCKRSVSFQDIVSSTSSVYVIKYTVLFVANNGYDSIICVSKQWILYCWWLGWYSYHILIQYRSLLILYQFCLRCHRLCIFQVGPFFGNVAKLHTTDALVIFFWIKFNCSSNFRKTAVTAWRQIVFSHSEKIQKVTSERYRTVSCRLSKMTGENISIMQLQ